MATGWQQIGGNWYYLGGSGAMATGWQQVDSTWYYFNGSGAMATGWQQIGGNWYYLGNSGAMATDWQQIGGNWYYLGDSGAMATGWKLIHWHWYYFQSNGAMAQNQWVDNYYLDRNGAMMINRTVTINGRSYTFDGNGRWSTPATDGSCPSWAPVKGNVNRQGEKIFHQPGDQSYKVTKPEQCFTTPDDAKSAGFRAAKR